MLIVRLNPFTFLLWYCCCKGAYSQVVNRRGGALINSSKFFQPPRSLLGPPAYWFSIKNSDRDIFTPDLLYVPFFLCENTSLTPIWSIFTWHYSSIGLINDSFAINQGEFSHFKGRFPPPFIKTWANLDLC